MLFLKLMKCSLHLLTHKEKFYLQNWGVEHHSIVFQIVIILRLRPFPTPWNDIKKTDGLKERKEGMFMLPNLIVSFLKKVLF